jgi:RNase P subunit RPR2
MLASLLNSLFGCSHRRTTFPLTPSRKMASATNRHGTYVVCLDCGQELRYDWKEMRVGEPVASRTPAAPSTSLSPANH